jgi:hypothetical protein
MPALWPGARGRVDAEISQPKRALQKNVSLYFGSVLGQDVAKAGYTFQKLLYSQIANCFSASRQLQRH